MGVHNAAFGTQPPQILHGVYPEQSRRVQKDIHKIAHDKALVAAPTTLAHTPEFPCADVVRVAGVRVTHLPVDDPPGPVGAPVGRVQLDRPGEVRNREVELANLRVRQSRLR